MWILLVTPDRDRLKDVRRWLGGRGHHVVGASGCAEALAHLRLHPFDLVASDPDCANGSWAASLRDRWDTFDVPLVLFRELGDLLDPLRRLDSELSREPPEKSARTWPGPAEARMASRLLSLHRAARRR